MKKAMFHLMALAVVMSMSAFAQDTMKSDSAKSAKSDKAKNISGWISDDKCGAQGAKAGHVDCAKKCIDGGQKMVFVGDKDKKVWNIENPDALSGHEGHHVRVNAHVNKDDGSIHVNSVKMLAQGKAKADKKHDAMHESKS